jgi:hypothetical protein
MLKSALEPFLVADLEHFQPMVQVQWGPLDAKLEVSLGFVSEFAMQLGYLLWAVAYRSSVDCEQCVAECHLEVQATSLLEETKLGLPPQRYLVALRQVAY